MFALWNKLARDGRGNSTVELAVALPVLLLMVVGMVDYGRAVNDAEAVQKGLIAAGTYLARHSSPSTTTAENLVKTGTMDGSGGYLVDGWGETGASFDITTGSFAVGDSTIPVYTLTAKVPFVPLFPGLSDWFGLGDFTIERVHEQAHVGD